jgi:hypothetical protein
MAEVPAFHTRNTEKTPVYHDQDGCHDGKAIKPADKVLGKGTGRQRCSECKRIG